MKNQIKSVHHDAFPCQCHILNPTSCDDVLNHMVKTFGKFSVHQVHRAFDTMASMVRRRTTTHHLLDCGEFECDLLVSNIVSIGFEKENLVCYPQVLGSAEQIRKATQAKPDDDDTPQPSFPVTQEVSLASLEKVKIINLNVVLPVAIDMLLVEQAVALLPPNFLAIDKLSIIGSLGRMSGKHINTGFCNAASTSFAIKCVVRGVSS